MSGDPLEAYVAGHTVFQGVADIGKVGAVSREYFAVYGGGKGMLMMAPPIYDCYKAIIDRFPDAKSRRVVYLSPRGRVFDQKRRGNWQAAII